MKTSKLSFTKTDFYKEGECNFRIRTTVSLDDDCWNQIYEWSVTAEIMIESGFGGWNEYMAGCCHEKIEEHCHMLAEFVPLHKCNHYGMPNVHNGRYFVEEGDRDTAMKYLRISDKEYDKLSEAADDYIYFKYLLFEMGIVERWRKESERLIKKLEALCGKEWVNPYSKEIERPVMYLDADEKKEIEKRISEGYYDPDSIKERREAERRNKIEEEKRDIIRRYEKSLSEIEAEKRVMMYILDKGISVNNVIYHSHNNTCVFNWRDCDDKISQEEFVDFINSVDYSKLPEGIEFKIKGE